MWHPASAHLTSPVIRQVLQYKLYEQLITLLCATKTFIDLSVVKATQAYTLSTFNVRQQEWFLSTVKTETTNNYCSFLRSKNLFTCNTRKVIDFNTYACYFSVPKNKILNSDIQTNLFYGMTYNYTKLSSATRFVWIFFSLKLCSK